MPEVFKEFQWIAIELRDFLLGNEEMEFLKSSEVWVGLVCQAVLWIILKVQECQGRSEC